jgi:lipoyl(octanoyl) transferase
MILEVLPDRTGGAAENMAADFLLLQRYPREKVARYRHYGWRSPAFTFGYSQKISFVREPASRGRDIRPVPAPTGGGIVDHRDDWTYAVVIPRGHPLEEVRGDQSYRAIHEALARAFTAAGVPVALKASPEPRRGDEPGGPGGRVLRARRDVRRRPRGVRRKDRRGRPEEEQARASFPGIGLAAGRRRRRVDWDRLRQRLRRAAGRGARRDAAPSPWPEFSEGELEGLVEQYSSAGVDGLPLGSVPWRA